VHYIRCSGALRAETRWERSIPTCRVSCNIFFPHQSPRCNVLITGVISEAYIHGIMDGEFMEKKTVTVEFPLC
jgi:hypothetical protein